MKRAEIFPPRPGTAETTGDAGAPPGNFAPALCAGGRNASVSFIIYNIGVISPICHCIATPFVV